MSNYIHAPARGDIQHKFDAESTWKQMLKEMHLFLKTKNVDQPYS